MPLLVVNPTGGHSGGGEGIGVAVFFIFFLVGFLLGFFEEVVVLEDFGDAVADYDATGLLVAVGLGLTFGVGVTPYAVEASNTAVINEVKINLIFILCSI